MLQDRVMMSSIHNNWSDEAKHSATEKKDDTATGYVYIPGIFINY